MRNNVKWLFTSFMMIAFAASAAYGQQAKVIFSASFETDAKANISAGDSNPIKNKKAFEFSDGVSGSSILVTPETSLVYKAVKNIDPNAGTLSFWVQPVDWDLKKNGWYPLFWLGTEQCYNAYYYLLLNVGDTGTSLSFFSRCDGKEKVAQNGDIVRSNVFKQGEWTHVVCAWSNWQFFLYVNGNQIAQFNYSLPFKQLAVKDNFMLWFAGTKFWEKNLNYSTRIDQVEIYDAMLTPSQIKQKYLSNNSTLVKKIKAPIIPISLSDKKIVVDGQLTHEEWSDASQVPLNKQFFQSHFVSRPAWCQLKYDHSYLYVAIDVETFNRLLTPGSGRDKKVFEGDSFEILMRPPGYQNKDDAFIQFAIGANGAWAFFKNNEWNIPTAIQKAVVRTDRGWSAEIAIPLDELYVRPVADQPWLIQLGVNCYSEDKIGSMQDRLFAWSGVTDSGLQKYASMYHNPDVMGKAIFQKDNNYFRIERSGNLNIGQLDLSITGTPTIESKVQILCPEKTVLERSSNKGASLAIHEKLSFLGEGLLTIEGTKKGQSQPSFLYQTLFNVKDPVTFLPEFYADESAVMLSIDASGLENNLIQMIQKEGLSGKAELVSAKKTTNQNSELYGQTTFTLKSIEQKVKLSFKDLPPGWYRIIVILSANKLNVQKDYLFERPDPDFLTRKCGVDRSVPVPWTPIQVREDSAAKSSIVKVVGRTYTFDEIGLPAKVESFGQQVLSQPVSFSASIRNVPQRFIAISQETKEKADDKVILTGTAKTQDGSIKMKWTRTIEFDGMILYQVELIPTEGRILLDSLMLKMVVPAESARYLMKPDCIVDWNKTGEHHSMPTNFFWLTGIKTGIEFFTPDDGNWIYNEKNPPVSIIRKNQDVELRCRFITRPVQVSKPLRYTFGFMATPVKPITKNWRSVHVNGWGNPKGQTLQDYWGYNDKTQGIQFPNLCLLTELTHEKEGLAEIADWHAKGIKVVPMALHTSMPDTNPYYDYYGTVWTSTMNGRANPKSFRSKWQGKEFYMCSPVCPASGFSDFLSWCVDRLVNKYGFDGVYLDGSYTHQCDNAHHGCGFVDAFGRKIQPWNDLGCRESFKRMYKIIHKKKTDGFLYTHSGAALVPHVHSMVDLVLPGEDLMPNVPGNPNYYTDAVPLERWQSTYNIANLMGTMATFLGLSQRMDIPLTQAPGDPNISRPLMTMCLLHDINLFGNFIYYKTIEKYWQVLDKTGISSGEAEFIGYWYPQAEIKSDNPKVLISYYRWPGNRKLVLVIGNPSPDPQEVQIAMPSKLIKTGIQAKNAFTGEQIDVTRPIKIENRSFLVVVFE